MIEGLVRQVILSIETILRHTKVWSYLQTRRYKTIEKFSNNFWKKKTVQQR